MGNSRTVEFADTVIYYIYKLYIALLQAKSDVLDQLLQTFLIILSLCSVSCKYSGTLADWGPVTLSGDQGMNAPPWITGSFPEMGIPQRPLRGH